MNVDEQALCGVAAGCTKTSITSHFALKANMADIAAKENAQETAVNACGMVSEKEYGCSKRQSSEYMHGQHLVRFIQAYESALLCGHADMTHSSYS